VLAHNGDAPLKDSSAAGNRNAPLHQLFRFALSSSVQPLPFTAASRLFDGPSRQCVALIRGQADRDFGPKFSGHTPELSCYTAKRLAFFFVGRKTGDKVAVFGIDQELFQFGF
jgi:hypothetical protein